jgi:hypothetical protein
MGRRPLTAEERDRRAVDNGFDFEDLPNGNPVPKKLQPDTEKAYGKIRDEWDT